MRLKSFIQEFVVEMKKHDLELVIVELERMSNPDFKLKATSKDLQSRLLAIRADLNTQAVGSHQREVEGIIGLD